MDAARWARLDALLDEVLSLEEAQAREARCASVRRDDPALADELDALLAADAALSALDAPMLGPAQDEALGEGALFGDWRVIRPLGAGGMGEVALVERVGRDFAQRGALKRLRVDRRARAEVVERFRQERQVLARLSDHANIAAILDGGVAASGELYLVMEHVAGAPLLQAADARALSVRARIALLLQVCDAVQHMHQRLIIHRDLKPANVLVREDGQVKLLDFGVAKVLAPWEGLALHETATQERAMTPAWAAPEQLRGEPLTTACDVYALGLLLHALLVEVSPWGEEATSWGELVSQREREALTPAQALARLDAARARRVSEARGGLSRARLARELGGELDAIVAKALRPEAAQRYASAQALASDLRAHLAGEAVTARRGSWRYSARRLWRRHRVAVSVAALLVVFALIYGVTLRAQTTRLTAQRDVAQREARKHARLARMMERMLSGADPGVSAAREVSARELLDEGARAAEVELASAPEERAALGVVLGGSYHSLGRLAQAEAQLVASLAHYEAPPGTPSADRARARLALARVRVSQGRIDEAEALMARALEDARASHAAQAPGALEAVIAASEALGAHYVYTRPGLLRAQQHLTRALALRRAHKPDEAQPQLRLRLALAEVERARGRPEEAVRLYEAILAELEARPDDAPLQRAEVLHALALASETPARARQALREAVTLREVTLGPAHALVADTLQDEALTLEAQGRVEEAVATMGRALASYDEALGPEHPRALASARELGAMLRDAGELEQARALLERAVSGTRAAPSSDAHQRALQELERLDALARVVAVTPSAAPVADAPP